MVFLIVFLIIMSICIHVKRDDQWIFGWGNIILESFMSSILATCILFFAIGILLLGCETEKYVEQTTSILALQDSNSIKGTYFLGSGNTNGSMKYIYLTKKDEGVTMNTLDAHDVILIESNKPKLVIESFRYKNTFLRNNFLCLKQSVTKIYIPKNSIKYNYNVDLN